MNKIDEMSDAKKWFEKERPKYEHLADHVAMYLQEALSQAGIPYLFIQHRAKEIERFLGKIKSKDEKKEIYNYTEIHDLAGARVVALFFNQCEAVNGLIQAKFQINNESLTDYDRSAKLEPQEIGYRGYHWICKFKEDAKSNSKYATVLDTWFEIQVHSALSFTWAEAQHDPVYKQQGQLTQDMERRYWLLAGTLEFCDRELIRLRTSMKEELQVVRSNPALGLNVDLVSNRLDYDAVEKYLLRSLPKTHQHLKSRTQKDKEEIEEELFRFGIRSLKNLEELIPKQGAVLDVTQAFSSVGGVLRLFMIRHDIKRYYESGGAWEVSKWQLSKGYIESLTRDRVDTIRENFPEGAIGR